MSELLPDVETAWEGEHRDRKKFAGQLIRPPLIFSKRSWIRFACHTAPALGWIARN